jgi:hypothetical protein
MAAPQQFLTIALLSGERCEATKGCTLFGTIARRIGRQASGYRVVLRGALASGISVSVAAVSAGAVLVGREMTVPGSTDECRVGGVAEIEDAL